MSILWLSTASLLPTLFQTTKRDLNAFNTFFTHFGKVGGGVKMEEPVMMPTFWPEQWSYERAHGAWELYHGVLVAW